jgi:hypothetical protein
MTTVFERVETALGTVSPAISFASAPYKGTLPNAYVTHQLINSPAEQHADNVETERSYTMQLTFWDKAGIPSTTNVDTAMKVAGFHKGDVRQLPQDAQTHHYGLAVEYFYLETQE